MEDIAVELLETIRWIPKEEREGTKWYFEYLDKVNKELKELNEKNEKRRF